MRTVAILILTVLLSCACKNEGEPLQPRSSSRPYEVLAVDDRDSIIYKVLDKDVEGLPQSEPSFDITATTESRMDNTARLARAIVKLTVDERQFTTTRIRYERNVYARPQIIVYITTPSVPELKKAMEKDAPKLRNLLTSFEIAAESTALTKRNNPKAQEKIRRMFGVDMLIPSDMQSEKVGKDFIWLSDNAKSGMKSICVYSSSSADAIRVRDSVMRRNIPGERDGMYMKTSEGSVTFQQIAERYRKQGKTVIARGLWEMENDAMGGPFVLHVTRQGNRYIYTEGFVYAPETSKRNRIRQTEAVLYTMKKNKGN